MRILHVIQEHLTQGGPLASETEASASELVDGFVTRLDALGAKARPEVGPTRSEPVREDAAKVQRELATVPLRMPLGLVNRARTHVQTLVRDPKDFAGRAQRWAARRLERAKLGLSRR